MLNWLTHWMMPVYVSLKCLDSQPGPRIKASRLVGKSTGNHGLPEIIGCSMVLLSVFHCFHNETEKSDEKRNKIAERSAICFPSRGTSEPLSALGRTWLPAPQSTSHDTSRGPARVAEPAMSHWKKPQELLCFE